MPLTTRIRAAVAAVESAGGVVRSTTLLAAGHSQRVLDAMIAGGLLKRVRRVWLVGPSAEPSRVAAARGGVLLTCVTEAKRLGLWVMDEDARAHVAVPRHRGHVDVAPGTVLHWARPVVPRDRDELSDPIENVLAAVASCRPREEALAVWESALRKGLVDPLTLQRLPFTGAARELRAGLSPVSDSGLETLFLLRSRRWGVLVVPQVWIAGHDVDFLIGERLVVQIDGATHVGAQRSSDIEHDARLKLMGYHVIRIAYDHVVHRWPQVQAVILRAVAQGLHQISP
jgi:very-short-patch-repair endonuclease